MEKALDVVSIGEILIDFVGKEQCTALMDVTEFKRAAGGGPANVAVGAARLGIRAGFVGKVGYDAFGRHLEQILESNSVNTAGLVVDPSVNTTLVFVALNQKGIPDFSFFRHGTADTLLRIDELPVALLQETKILHFSSVSLTTEPSRSACLKAVEIAREAGAIITFDPNLRLPLWPDATTAKAEILAAAALADVLKMNEEEYLFLTGTSINDNENIAGALWNDRLKLLAVTQGERGSALFGTKETIRVPALPVQVLDTTGAGDAYMAGVITVLAESPDMNLIDYSCLVKIGRWAGAAAALACQHSGGIPSLPDREGVVAMINSAQMSF
jgi:fructokinase